MRVIDGEESLIFDFNLEVGIVLLQTWEPNVYSKLRVTETDNMTLPNGEKGKSCNSMRRKSSRIKKLGLKALEL